MKSGRRAPAEVSRRTLLTGFVGLAVTACSAARTTSEPSSSGADAGAADPTSAATSPSAGPTSVSGSPSSSADPSWSADPSSAAAPSSALTSPAATGPSASSAATSPTATSPAAAARTTATASTVPAAAQAPSDAAPVGPVLVQVPASGHTVPGLLLVPGGTTGPVPVVVMLHGDGANDAGPGALFIPLAQQLAKAGIASMRIDFAGSVPSVPNQSATQKQTDLTYTGMVLDTSAVIGFLSADARFDPQRVALVGHSRGGEVGATVAGTAPGIAAFVSWSGLIVDHPAVSPVKYAAAKAAGHYLDGGWDYSVAWYDTVTASTALTDVKPYQGPVLGLVGSLDTVDVPSITQVFIKTSTSPDKTYHEVTGADHTMGAGNTKQTTDTLDTTADWLAARLVRG